MICFVVALKKEAELLLERSKNLKSFKIADKIAYSFNLEDKECVLVVCGIGKVSACLTAQILIDKYNPSYIFNFGTCGGMNDSVKILNYYAVEKCCQYDFDVSSIDDVPVGYIQEYDRVYFDACVNGLDFLEKRNIASADKFTHKDEDVKIINDMNCSICDMEAGAIAQVCTSNNVPFVAIKGISDVHGKGTQPEQFFENLKKVGDGFPDIIIKAINNIKL
jgi:adenosylhomocysteine nucleosidase